MEVLLKALISLAIAGIGIYVLMHANTLAQRLQNIYIRSAMRVQEKKDFRSHLFMYNPETWKTPFATLMFKGMAIFFGIWLLIIAYPIVFGPVQL